MSDTDLSHLRHEIETLNLMILDLLSKRGRLVEQIAAIKRARGMPTFVPEREQHMLEELVAHNTGPFSDETIRHLFREIFKASQALQDTEKSRILQTSRLRRAHDLTISIGDVTIGGSTPAVIAGPCAVESEHQMESVASFLAQKGVRFLRGGAFKPRSSPYSFQGLGIEGLHLLSAAARRHGLFAVTELVDPRHGEVVAQHAHILQIGARNMHNYELLREVGRIRKPVLLKRGLSATIDEFLWAAEYIVLEGNENVILCERGIRTFENQTRNTLDISAVALLRQKTYLPVVVDVSHAAGRRDILAPLARAALAAGAQGLMIEVHPCPILARSDAEQQLDFDGFDQFLQEVGIGHRYQQAVREQAC